MLRRRIQRSLVPRSFKIGTQGGALINLLQLFLFEDLSRVVGKLNFVQRYTSRMDIAGNMLRELANVNAVADFAAQRVLTLSVQLHRLFSIET